MCELNRFLSECLCRLALFLGHFAIQIALTSSQCLTNLQSDFLDESFWAVDPGAAFCQLQVISTCFMASRDLKVMLQVYSNGRKQQYDHSRVILGLPGRHLT